MKRLFPHLPVPVMAALLLLAPALASAEPGVALTWDQVKARFEAANPALKADALGVDEMKAAEITAFLRPNPQFTASTDANRAQQRSLGAVARNLCTAQPQLPARARP